MYLFSETDLMKTVAYTRSRPLEIFTRRLTTNNGSADVALGSAVVGVTDVVNTLRPEIHLHNILKCPFLQHRKHVASPLML